MKTTRNLIITSIVIGLAILAITVYTSETIFGDLTQIDSYKPLWVVVPIMLTVFGFLLYKFKKK